MKKTLLIIAGSLILGGCQKTTTNPTVNSSQSEFSYGSNLNEHTGNIITLTPQILKNDADYIAMTNTMNQARLMVEGWVNNPSINITVINQNISNCTSLSDISTLLSNNGVSNPGSYISLINSISLYLNNLLLTYPGIESDPILGAQVEGTIRFMAMPPMDEQGGSQHPCDIRYREAVDLCDAAFAAEMGVVLVGAGIAMAGTPAAAGLTLGVGTIAAAIAHEICLQGAENDKEDCFDNQ